MRDYRTMEQVPRFQLDRRPGRSRMKLRCPQCGKERCLTPYIDTVTGQPVGTEFGRCDHERRCGYDKRPTGKDIGDKPLFASGNEVYAAYKPPAKPDVVNYIPASEWMCSVSPETMKSSLFRFLSFYWDETLVESIFRRYFVGYMGIWSWKDCPVFWQVDKDFYCRTGKIMEYAIREEEGVPVDVKRVKGEGENAYPHVMFYHALKSGDYLLKQCLFGEHLLNWFPASDEIHLVESEKTALVCALNSPEKMFMATGGLKNLRPDVMNVLRGRKVIAYPDKGSAYDDWKSQIEKNLVGMDIHLSDFLQGKDYIEDGGDMADFFIGKKVSLFKQLKDENKNMD